MNLLGQVSLRVRDAVDGRLAEATGLAPGHAGALLTLQAFAEGERPETLAGALGLSQSGAVHLVDRLVAKGWVRRTPDPDDGRAVRLRLTPAGRRTAEVLRAAREEGIRELLDGLAPGEREALLSPLVRLAATGVETPGAAGRVCRQCDTEACGHPGRCPVTVALDERLDRPRA